MRSVVLRSVPRCDRCHLPVRWCICAGHQPIICPLQIDVLMHHRELHRPSSTGHLIQRLFTGSRHFPYRQGSHPEAASVRLSGRELWILHPHGEPAPQSTLPENLQVLLLDGAWGETSAMAKAVGSWGRLVSLPMSGESRFWLREQQDGGRFSTAEALMFLLRSLGLVSAAEQLSLQFELHVYASLRARGRKESAAEFLQRSLLMNAMPELIDALNTRRPR